MYLFQTKIVVASYGEKFRYLEIIANYTFRP